MGLYDRSYYRGDERGIWVGGHSVVVNLIIANVVVYLADVLSNGQVTPWLALDAQWFQHPWEVWRLVTYGFVHVPQITHILFNMFFLYWFGRGLEPIYGAAELLRIYLVAIVLAGLAWLAVTTASGGGGALVGASGGVMGLMILYVLHFPRQIFMVWGVLPVPAWAFAGFYVLGDLLGALHPADSRVANVAHLAGAAFGFVYFRTGMRLGRLIPTRFSDFRGSLFRMRPKLRIHEPRDESRELGEKVDAILEKISQQGEASLTKQERRTLEEASRRYQRRRQ